jgi:hypothetical protein
VLRIRVVVLLIWCGHVLYRGPFKVAAAVLEGVEVVELVALALPVFIVVKILLVRLRVIVLTPVRGVLVVCINESMCFHTSVLAVSPEGGPIVNDDAPLYINVIALIIVAHILDHAASITGLVGVVTTVDQSITMVALVAA